MNILINGLSIRSQLT